MNTSDLLLLFTLLGPSVRSPDSSRLIYVEPVLEMKQHPGGREWTTLTSLPLQRPLLIHPGWIRFSTGAYWCGHANRTNFQPTHTNSPRLKWSLSLMLSGESGDLIRRRCILVLIIQRGNVIKNLCFAFSIVLLLLISLLNQYHQPPRLDRMRFKLNEITFVSCPIYIYTPGLGVSLGRRWRWWHCVQ